jgi:hypothetical protein
LPWYFRDRKRVGYYAQVMRVEEAIVLCSGAQEGEIKALLGDDYRRVGSYTLRPGLELVLYARQPGAEHRQADS